MNNAECWLKDSCNHRDCNVFCMKFFKLSVLYDKALITLPQRKYINLRIDKDKKDLGSFTELKNIEENISAFISEGKNLYIHSQIAGNGKTSWALRLVNSYFNAIWCTSRLECRALFINVPRFLLALKDNISQQSEYIQHIKDNVLTADVVIWDDIGTKAATSFEAEHLLSMIDTRIADGKSNIYTSNLSQEEIHEILGDRLTSRIVNASLDIVLYGNDKRVL